MYDKKLFLAKNVSTFGYPPWSLEPRWPVDHGSNVSYVSSQRKEPLTLKQIDGRRVSNEAWYNAAESFVAVGCHL